MPLDVKGEHSFRIELIRPSDSGYMQSAERRRDRTSSSIDRSVIRARLTCELSGQELSLSRRFSCDYEVAEISHVRRGTSGPENE